jgi:CO/xanthine dehydrogenase FAD-binding subunit
MRRLPKFDYIAPQTIDEACSLLAQYKDRARVMAGGTDLLPKMKNREVVPQYVIGLSAIPGLDYIEYEKGKGLRIGALATLAAVMSSPAVRERFGLLAEAVSQMASVQIRNRGTVAGNLCNAVPSADTVPPLIVLGAKVKLVTRGKERVVAVEDLCVAPNVTCIAEGELLTEIQVPEPPRTSGGAYLKLTPRRALDLAIVGVAAMVARANGTCEDVKIALGAVAPTPVRAKRAEDMLRGKALKDMVLKQAAEAAMKEAHPISDVRASEEYRRKMVGVLTERAVRQAWERAKAK